MTLREVEPWRDKRLRCAIGHEYAGRVRLVQDRHKDMDGEWMAWQPSRDDYDPPKCIVCGLMTWARAK